MMSGSVISVPHDLNCCQSVKESLTERQYSGTSPQGDEKFRQRIEGAVKVAPGKDSELLRFPMSLGDPREDKDHSGEPCTVLDIVFSPQTMDMAGNSRQDPTIS